MVKVNFEGVESPETFEALPAGTYLISISDVVEDETQDGDPFWRLQLTVEDGEFEGRRLFDNLVFTRAGYPKVKSVCEALGLDCKGEVELKPSMLREKSSAVAVRRTKFNGEWKNAIPFAGWLTNGTDLSIDSEPTHDTNPLGDDDVPF